MPSGATDLRRKTQQVLYNMRSSEKLSEMALLELDFEGCVGVFWAEKNSPCELTLASVDGLRIRPHSLGCLAYAFKCWQQQTQAEGAFISS